MLGWMWWPVLCSVAWGAFLETAPSSSSSNAPDWNNPKFVYDEKEDEPVTLDVKCDRFLAPNVDDAHIAALFSEMPLELKENMLELTQDEVCRPLALNRCHLLTGSQLVKVIETLGLEGVQGYAESGCLRRMGKLAPLSVDHVKLLAKAGVFELDQWYTMHPRSLLALMEASKFTVSLPSVPTDLNLLIPFMQDWKAHPSAWELFDDRFVEAIAKSKLVPVQEAFVKLLGFERLNLIKGKGSVALRLKILGRLALQHQSLLLQILGHLGQHGAAEEAVISQLVSQMKEGTLFKCSTKSKSNKDLRASVMPLWNSPVWTLSQALSGENQLTKKVALLRRSILSLSPTLQESLRQLFDQPVLDGQAVWSLLNDSLLDDNPAAGRWRTTLLKLNLRPQLSEAELSHFHSLIANDIAKLQENVSRRNPDAGDGTRVSDIPSTLVEWLAQASFVGNSAMFDYLAAQLPGITGDFGVTEDALVRLAEKNHDLRDAAISLLRRPDRVITLLLKTLRSTSGSQTLKIKRNAPLEYLESKEALEKPMAVEGDEEETKEKREAKERAQVEERKALVDEFLASSFKCLLEESGKFINRSFTIKYGDQDGADGGGLRRNWIYRMLTVMMDKGRGFFALPQGTVGLVMEKAVDPQMFLAFGRLLGRAFYEGVGMPHPLHAEMIDLLRLKAQHEKKLVTFEQYEQKAVSVLESFHGSMLNNVRYFDRKTPPSADTLDDFNDYNLATAEALCLTNAVQVNNYFKPVLRERFVAQEWSEVQEYAQLLKQNLKDVWISGVDAMYQGLAEFLHAELLSSVDRAILIDLFTPKSVASDEAWIAAFTFKHADNHWVRVRKSDGIDAAFLQPAPFAESSAELVISMNDAMRLALKRLTPQERLGLIGQVSGALQVGPSGLRPGMFKVEFRALKHAPPEPITPRPDLDAEALAAPSSGETVLMEDSPRHGFFSSEVTGQISEGAASSEGAAEGHEAFFSADDGDSNMNDDAQDEQDVQDEQEREEGELDREMNEESSSDENEMDSEPAPPPPQPKAPAKDIPTARSW